MASAAQPDPSQLDVVEHPQLGTLKFPKDMDFDQRNQIIQGMEAKMQAARIPPPPDTGWPSKNWSEENPLASAALNSFDITNVGKNLYQGAKAAVTGVGAVAKDLAANPNWLIGPDSTYAKFVGAPAEAERQKAVEALNQKRYSEAAGHTLASAVPIVGPLAASLGEQAGTGDIGGTIAKSAGMALAPKLAEGALGKAGDAVSLVGAKTRAVNAFENIEKVAGNYPVDPGPAMAVAQKAVELGKHGYTVPKPVTDFIDWIESQRKTPLTPVAGQPKAFISGEAPTMSPLSVRDARQFFSSTGEAIPWNQLGEGARGGRMHSLVIDMRDALDQSTKDALAPHGLVDAYDAAKADYARAMRWPKTAAMLGYIGGKLGGYAVGGVTGHPFMVGYAGGKLGSEAAENAARSMTEAGAKRGRPAVIPPPPLTNP